MIADMLQTLFKVWLTLKRIRNDPATDEKQVMIAERVEWEKHNHSSVY